MPEKFEKHKRPRLNFAIHTQVSKKKFERLSKQNDKWFKNYSESFSIKFDKVAMTKRLVFAMSFLSDFSTSVNVRFCDDVEMEKSNSEFRHKNEPTDVLSFPVSPFEWHEPDAIEKQEVSLGDLLICVPVCEWQAREARHSLSRELEKMVLHGLVHLKGFDHERNDAAWRVMAGLEELIEHELVTAFGEPSWCQIEESVRAGTSKRVSKDKTT